MQTKARQMCLAQYTRMLLGRSISGAVWSYWIKENVSGGYWIFFRKSADIPIKGTIHRRNDFTGKSSCRNCALLGHTKGSVGFWVLEERLLIAGNALNEGLWLFNYGALSMAQLYQTLQNTIRLDFDTYLGGHSSEEYPKESCLRISAISRI